MMVVPGTRQASGAELACGHDECSVHSSEKTVTEYLSYARHYARHWDVGYVSIPRDPIVQWEINVHSLPQEKAERKP